MTYIICTSLLYSHTILWWSYCRHTSTTSAAPKYCYTTSWNSYSRIKLANSHDMLPILPKDPTKSHVWTYFLVDGIQSEHRVMVKLLTKEWCETTANLSMSHVYTSHLPSLATGHCLSFYSNPEQWRDCIHFLLCNMNLIGQFSMQQWFLDN